MRKKGIFMRQFDAGDAKMTHNVTQHSKWNRKRHPYSLCECKRSEAVKSYTTRKCKITNDEDHLRHREKSAAKFTTKCNQDFSPKNVENHCDWADKTNYGIAHFGTRPKHLSLSNIAFDNLHCRLSIVRGIWSWLWHKWKIQRHFKGTNWWCPLIPFNVSNTSATTGRVRYDMSSPKFIIPYPFFYVSA